LRPAKARRQAVRIPVIGRRFTALAREGGKWANTGHCLLQNGTGRTLAGPQTPQNYTSARKKPSQPQKCHFFLKSSAYVMEGES